MRNDIKEETWLTAAQCAKRIGLTVRALRLYEQTGLIRPRRTGKNWRLYGANEIARLNEILTLKRLGLSLQHIARLLAGQAADLDRMLSMQNLALQEQLGRTQHSLAIVDTLRTKIAAGAPLSIEELLKLAKDTNMTDISSDTIAWRRYEQARPRTEQKIDLTLYAEYEGYYLLDRLAYVITVRDGCLFSRLTGQAELEIFPEDIDRFFYKAVQAQLAFTRDENGSVSGLVLHQNGYEQAAPRVEESVVAALEDKLAERIRDKRPVENSRALLKEIIDQHQRGEPDYERMSLPLVDAFFTWIAAQASRVSRKSDLGKALTYMLTRQEGFRLFLDDGHVDIDSNLVENAIRRPAMNRRNALFAGHDEGGRNWARFASLIGTCKMNGVEPYAYLCDLFTRLANGHLAKDIDALMPWAYAARIKAPQ